VKGSVQILEAETGSGKSEAAIAAFLSMRKVGLVKGLYFGLPTRTSAVQMHGRVSTAIRKALKDPPPVLLAVPGYMRLDDEDGKLVDGRNVLWDDDRISTAGWVAENAKRYLAAPIAVGTIDQLLLSVLDVKHGSMRWAAAARSLLVVDEVHASDPYMFALLSTVVRNHVNRGGHVLLMSATLGCSMAHACLSAVSGQMNAIPSLKEALTAPYPMIRTARPGKPWTEVSFPAEVRQKEVKVEASTIIDDPESIADLAAFHARANAKVLVIRNTVAGCVDVQRLMEERLAPEMLMRAGRNMVPSPHHGRFAPEDRRALDIAVEAAFGKDSPRRGIVLCATQTVEQSLDIDADIVITDICPVDVLLQRVGRLHRHTGRIPIVRPEGYEKPKVVVLVPSRPLTDFIAKPAHGIGPKRAYADVRVVELTLRKIREMGTFTIPADNRLLVEECTHPESLAALEYEDKVFESHGMDVRGISYGDQTTARLALRDGNWRPGDPIKSRSVDEHIMTRLGEVDLVVPFKDSLLTPFGEKVTYIKIPAWLSPRTRVKDTNVEGFTCLHDGSFSFTVEGESYTYSRFGLEKNGRDGLQPANRKGGSD